MQTLKRWRAQREKEDESGTKVVTAVSTLPLRRKKKLEYRQVAFYYINIHDSYKIDEIEM